MANLAAGRSARDRAGWLRRDAERALALLRLFLALIAILALGSPPLRAASGVLPAEEFDRICLETQAEISRTAAAAQSLGFAESEDSDDFAHQAKQFAHELFGLSQTGRVEAKYFSAKEPTRITDSVAVASIDGWRDSRHLQIAICLYVQMDTLSSATVAQITAAIADALKRRVAGEISVSDELLPDRGAVTWEWGPAVGSSKEGLLQYQYSKNGGLLLSLLSLGIGWEMP